MWRNKISTHRDFFSKNPNIKYQGLLTDVEIIEFEKFSDEEEGRENTKHDWFWVIDPDVEVHDDFNFDFIPDTWDEGKTHVWQKLNLLQADSMTTVV